MARLVSAVLVVASTVTVAVVAAPGARASAPLRCAQRLLNDYFPDAHVDGAYRVRCFRAAMSAVADDSIYGANRPRSDLREEFKRRVAVVRRAGLPVNDATVLKPLRGTGEPCWRAIVNDDFDGHIDNDYSVACYESALRRLPPPHSSGYGSGSALADEISRNFDLRREAVRASGKRITPDTVLSAGIPYRRDYGRHRSPPTEWLIAAFATATLVATAFWSVASRRRTSALRKPR